MWDILSNFQTLCLWFLSQLKVSDCHGNPGKCEVFLSANESTPNFPFLLAWCISPLDIGTHSLTCFRCIWRPDVSESNGRLASQQHSGLLRVTNDPPKQQNSKDPKCLKSALDFDSRVIFSFRSGFSTLRFSLKIKSFAKQNMFYRSDILHDFSISSF